MSTPSIKVGQGNWGIKAGNLLGYANTEKKFSPVEFTSTRASNTATRVNASGNIEIVNANIPRIDYFGGQASLLVEPSGTNSIRNNSMVGASVSGNTLPTNYQLQLAGLTRTIVDTGTENGIAYMDIRVSGTSTGGAVVLQEESSTFITAAQGQVWTHSVYAKLIANVLNMPSARVGMYEYTGGGSYLAEGSNPVVLTSSLNRFSFTRTLANASTTRVAPIVQWVVNNGVSYDFTVRIGYPQMETGSVATSVIPTTTVSGTRNADVVSVTGVAGLIGQTEGTIYAEVDVRNFVNFSRVVALSDGTNSNSIGLQLFLNGAVKSLRVGLAFLGSGQVDIIAAMPNAVNKIAVGYKQNDFVVYINGSSVGTNTSCSVPAMNKIDLGNINGVNIIADRIRAVSIYQTRLPNTTTDGSPSLQSITTL